MISMSAVAPKVSADHVFENPAKLIKTIDDMKIWERSEAYFEYLGFILAINEAVKGKSNSRGSENCSEAVLKVVNLLDKLDKNIDETPPVQQPQRFGNVAFRTWYQRLKDDSLTLLQEVLPTNLFKAIPEIVSYLVDSFGNSTRIDYGTGHEISFIMFLCCLFKIGVLKDTDKTATGCKIFPKYLDVARKLQITYRMEPAGSHGVWSLDDFQFVPFIWGSSQLFAHPTIQPGSFLEPKVLDRFGDDYMFLTCIRYINQVKTGPFAEHSNQLWSISGVSSWSKINSGLIKMYKAEVLSKFPVVQHIVFGTLFTLKAVEQSTGLMTARTSMVPPPAPFPKPSQPSVVERDSSVKSLSKVPSEGISIQTGKSGQSSISKSEAAASDQSGILTTQSPPNNSSNESISKESSKNVQSVPSDENSAKQQLETTSKTSVEGAEKRSNEETAEEGKEPGSK